jgi:hydroxysqualene dehydroxylase
VTRADVLVLGGGFAGLSAATAAAEAGARAVVLEARPAPGGRAGAFTDPATGERVDNGQHVLIGCYHETLRFLRRVGAADLVGLQSDLAVDVVDASGRHSRLQCPRLPAPLHLLAGAWRWPALGWRDRLAVLGMRAALRPRPSGGATAGTGGAHDPAGDPEQETVHAWLRRHGQTPRLIEVLWEPLAVAALNQSIDVAAAAPFATVLQRMFSGDRRDAALGLPRVPLDALYVEPSRSYVAARHGEVRVDAPARVHVNGHGCHVTVRGERLQAARVICAVPWYALAQVFAEAPAVLAPVLEAAAATAASPIVTVNLWFDRPVTDVPFVGLPGRTMQWVFDRRALVGASASHVSLVSSGAESVVRCDNRQLIELAMRELRGALPAARQAVLRRGVVVRERRATFSVAPGQPPRPSTDTPVPGLLLAGDWIDTGLPATIESAVVSGHRAAARALEHPR